MNDTNAKETPESGLKPEPDDALKNRPIGVFDSGMGGLTVLHELIQSLPDERFIYLGDTARVPYGSRSPETIRRYSMEVASYLVKQQIKYLVIACNTSTAHAEALLKEKMPVPVLGVIRPGVEALLAEGLVTVDPVRVLLYRHGPGKEVHGNQPPTEVGGQNV